MPKSSVAGTLVAVVGREFDPFTASNGDKISGGTAYKAWICESFDSAPVAHKVKAHLAERLLIAGPGCTVKSETWLRAKGDRIESELDADSTLIIPAD